MRNRFSIIGVEAIKPQTRSYLALVQDVGGISTILEELHFYENGRGEVGMRTTLKSTTEPLGKNLPDVEVFEYTAGGELSIRIKWAAALRIAGHLDAADVPYSPITGNAQSGVKCVLDGLGLQFNRLQFNIRSQNGKSHIVDGGGVSLFQEVLMHTRAGESGSGGHPLKTCLDHDL